MSERATRARGQLSTLFRFYVVRSLQLDRQTLRLRRWPLRQRLAFLASKWWAMPRLLRKRPASLRVGHRRFQAHSPLYVGSLQSCLADVHDELVMPGVLAGIEAPVVVDVGANVGQFLSAFTCFYPVARVTAMEPDPVIHGELQANAAGLDGVTTVCAAAGDAPGRLNLYRHPVSLMSTFRPGEVETYDPANRVSVDVITLDEATKDLGPVDLLKIDVEGFELEVLRGAASLLRRTRFLLIELGLGRETSGANLAALDLVHAVCPQARIVRFGRPLGDPARPICQDVLLELNT